MSDEVLTRRQVARLLGCHEDTVSRLVQDGPLAAAVVARRGRGGALRFSRAAVETYKAVRDEGREFDPARERARKDRADADLKEHRLAVERGDFLPRATVEQMQVAEATAVRAKILSWSTTIADHVHRAAIREGVAGVEAILERAAYEVLDELADPGRPIECPRCGADMTEATPASSTCGATTLSGKPCTRPAGDGGRCYQHAGA